jgi:hypothetical protein
MQPCACGGYQQKSKNPFYIPNVLSGLTHKASPSPIKIILKGRSKLNRSSNLS